jgi:hypothetical protein
MATPRSVIPRMSMQTLNVLAGRIDDLVTELGLSFNQMVLLQKRLLPEVYDPKCVPPDPAGDAGLPKTFKRISAMSRRYKHALPLFCDYDPQHEDVRAARATEWLMVIRLPGPDQYHAHQQGRALLGLGYGDDWPEGVSIERE